MQTSDERIINTKDSIKRTHNSLIEYISLHFEKYNSETINPIIKPTYDRIDQGAVYDKYSNL